MLAATRVLSRVQAHGITLVPDGDRLRERAQRKDSSPPPPAPGGGRDPLVHRGTEKGEFFKRGGDWRTTWPRDFKVYEGAQS